MKQPLTISNFATKQTKSQDSALWDEVKRIFQGFERTAFAKELKAVFENLHDDELLNALEKTRWTGRPGYPIRVMWRTLIASYVLNIGTIEGLRRRFHENPFLAVCCGIYSDGEIPSRFAYYRFIKKLLAHRELIEQCMAKCVCSLKENLSDFSESIAVDSTDIHTYSNPSSKKKGNPDPDASWSVKKDKHGKDKWWFGYKAHIACDSSYEVPLVVEVTAASVNDSVRLIPLLAKIRRNNPSLKFKYVIADAGYDAVENYRAIVEDFKAVPIIKLNLRGKTKRFEDLCDEYGTPYCAWNVPMVFWGYDKKQKVLKYRCPLACGKKGCTWIDKCSKSPYGQVVKIKFQDDYRRFCHVPRHTKRWGILYNRRGAIERVFSRLKEFRKLDNLHIRGLPKVSLHCQLAVLVVQARQLRRITILPF